MAMSPYIWRVYGRAMQFGSISGGCDVRIRASGGKKADRYRVALMKLKHGVMSRVGIKQGNRTAAGSGIGRLKTLFDFAGWPREGGIINSDISNYHVSSACVAAIIYRGKQIA